MTGIVRHGCTPVRKAKVKYTDTPRTGEGVGSGTHVPNGPWPGAAALGAACTFLRGFNLAFYSFSGGN